ncbi:UNVERIFIED_CONTAM: hypothetical protein GTU68_009040 [Idotea baltica]|nr:hypothetical protein [Idotea baltica]
MKGRVLRSTGSWYTVKLPNADVLECRIKGKFRLKALKLTNPIAAGDYVEVEKEAGLETAIITKIYERNNYIIRKSPRKPGHFHIIASNIDMAYLVVSLKMPQTSTGFIDRFLMVAEMYHIPATIIVNKADLYTEKELTKWQRISHGYQQAGYKIILMSAEKAEDIEALKQNIQHQTNLFAGQSGVGKSTLINALQPQLSISTKKVSNYSEKGMHTTTFAQLHPISQTGYIIDTPGIKELEATDFQAEEVSHYFPEMRERLLGCKFNNCLHKNEPKCAITKAVEDGEIAEFRYHNYINILLDKQAQNSWDI